MVCSSIERLVYVGREVSKAISARQVERFLGKRRHFVEVGRATGGSSAEWKGASLVRIDVGRIAVEKRRVMSGVYLDSGGCR